MVTILGFVNGLIFVAISLVHFNWAFGGGKSSLKMALPETTDGSMPLKPSKYMTAGVAFIFLLFGLFYFQKVGIVHFELPDWLERYGLIVLGSVLLMRAVGDFRYVGFFKTVKTTPFGRMDTRYYAPLCLVLSVSTFWIQMN